MNIQNDTDFVQLSPFKRDKRGSWMVADKIEYELLKENAKANLNNMTEAKSAFGLLAKTSGLGEKRNLIYSRWIYCRFLLS